MILLRNGRWLSPHEGIDYDHDHEDAGHGRSRRDEPIEADGIVRRIGVREGQRTVLIGDRGAYGDPVGGGEVRVRLDRVGQSGQAIACKLYLAITQFGRPVKLGGVMAEI